MGRLLYIANESLDGYVEDADGSFDWTYPSEEHHTFIGDLIKPVGTYLYGRRMYESMAVWETWDPPEAFMHEFATTWRAAEKIVYSTTLEQPTTPKTRIERTFDPEVVRAMKAEGDLAIGGATIAAHAIRAGIVDDFHRFVIPVMVGGGKRSLPDGARLELELVTERRFPNGMVYLHHRARD